MSNKRWTHTLSWSWFALVSLSLAVGFACAHNKAKAEENTEDLLSAAGFERRAADTPEKQAHLQTLEQKKLLAFRKDGEFYYVYADAADCGCLYAGDEAAYQRYKALAVEQKISEERLEAARANRDAAMSWNTWGPWPWW